MMAFVSAELHESERLNIRGPFNPSDHRGSRSISEMILGHTNTITNGGLGYKQRDSGR